MDHGVVAIHHRHRMDSSKATKEDLRGDNLIIIIITTIIMGIGIVAVAGETVVRATIVGKQDARKTFICKIKNLDYALCSFHNRS